MRTYKNRWTAEKLISCLSHCHRAPNAEGSPCREFSCLSTDLIPGYSQWLDELAKQLASCGEPRIQAAFDDLAQHSRLVPCVMQMIFVLFWDIFEFESILEVTHKMKIDLRNTKRMIDGGCADLSAVLGNCEAEAKWLSNFPALASLHDERDRLIARVEPELSPLQEIESSIVKDIKAEISLLREQSRIAAREYLVFILRALQSDGRMRWQQIEIIIQFAGDVFWESHRGNK